MGTEADTNSPRNEGHIGTGRGYNGVTDSNIGKLSYRDAQCEANIGQFGYISYGYYVSCHYMAMLHVNDVKILRKHLLDANAG